MHSFYIFSNKLESEKCAHLVLKFLGILIPSLLEAVDCYTLAKSYIEGKLLAEATSEGI